MVRLTVDLINDSLQYINTVRERELSLRACKIPVLENLGVTRDQFDTIDLTDNDIRKLDNIPLLKRLSALLMHNNRVQQIMPNLGEVLPSLRTLALTNNNLCELGDIDPLATCKKLEYLTLIGNPVTHKPQYRLYVIYKVPSVRVLDFKRVRLSERQQAASVFKGKKGQKVREQVVKKSRPLPEDERVEAAKTMRGEDARKIQEAIESASTLAEVDHLQSILQGGRIPEKGWNLPVSAPSSNAGKSGESREENAFVPETEDENEEKTSEEAVVSVDSGDAVDKRGNDRTSATESCDMPLLDTVDVEKRPGKNCGHGHGKGEMILMLGETFPYAARNQRILVNCRRRMAAQELAVTSTTKNR
uniref:Probable U2 small nuclear ribonucleoprotein A' n=1 Tax=Parascaris univalens TaxID=6257 RepID=A0A915AIZ6_PARUN